MDDLLAKKSFVLWIKGECPPEEKEYWDSWLQEDPDHRLKAGKPKKLFQLWKANLICPTLKLN